MITADNTKRSAELEAIIRRSRSQGDIVRSLKELAPDYMDRFTETFTNAAILTDQAFKGEEAADVLSSSVFLALRARRGFNTLIFTCYDAPYESVPVPVGGNFQDMTRKELADIAASAFTKEPRALGFSIGFRSTNGVNNGYSIYLMRATDGSDRFTVLEKSCDAYIEKSPALAKEMYDKEIGDLTHSEADLLHQKLRASVSWQPKYTIHKV